jgi:hypothetical protein
MVKLNKKFYSKEAIFETKKEFKDVCECRIKEGNTYFNISIIAKGDQYLLDFEFANYALSLMR